MADNPYTMVAKRHGRNDRPAIGKALVRIAWARMSASANTAKGSSRERILFRHRDLGADRTRAKWPLTSRAFRYYGRTYSEGKQIRWSDGLKALCYLIKFRFAR